MLKRFELWTVIDGKAELVGIYDSRLVMELDAFELMLDGNQDLSVKIIELEICLAA